MARPSAVVRRSADLLPGRFYGGCVGLGRFGDKGPLVARLTTCTLSFYSVVKRLCEDLESVRNSFSAWRGHVLGSFPLFHA